VIFELEGAEKVPKNHIFFCTTKAILFTEGKTGCRTAPSNYNYCAMENPIYVSANFVKQKTFIADRQIQKN